jgi:hypothetical protein
MQEARARKQDFFPPGTVLLATTILKQSAPGSYFRWKNRHRSGQFPQHDEARREQRMHNLFLSLLVYFLRENVCQKRTYLMGYLEER